MKLDRVKREDKASVYARWIAVFVNDDFTQIKHVYLECSATMATEEQAKAEAKTLVGVRFNGPNHAYAYAPVAK